MRLFPQVAWAFGGPAYGHDFWEEWYRELRVCSPDIFDRYFIFAIPSGDLPQANLERILSLVGDRPALTRYFFELERQDLLEVAIDRLEAYKEEIGLENAIPFVTSLFDIGDLLPRLGGRMLIDPATHAVRIIYFFLRREPNVERREEVLRTAILDTVGLVLPVMTVSWESNASTREKDSQTMLVRADQLPRFQEITVAKIRDAADRSILATHPHLAYLLYRWRDWANPEEPRGWVRKQLRTPKGVLTLLGAFTQEIHSRSLGDYVGRVQKRIPLSQLEEFISLEDVAEQLKLIALDNLTLDERQVIEVFEEARQRRVEGKGDEFSS